MKIKLEEIKLINDKINKINKKEDGSFRRLSEVELYLNGKKIILEDDFVNELDLCGLSLFFILKKSKLLKQVTKFEI
tara:strand:- start:1077 stop:1307 length:231 start_codon:yes stop_codon:yes gene_type:complete